MKTSTIDAADGTSLFTRAWLPKGSARAAVIIVHGFKAHSGLYDWPALQLVQRAFAVHSFDLRGHGQSQGERYHVARFSDYLDDLQRFVGLVNREHPGRPLFVLGHSVGGVIAALFVARNHEALAGLISEDLAHELPPPELALSLLKGVSHLLPHAHLLNLKEEDFSRDQDFVTRLKADPFGNHQPGTAQLLAELIRADEQLRAEFAAIRLPLLILHGTADRIAKPSGSQHFYEKAASADKEIKLYEGHYHDLLNDLGKEQVMADIVAWLEARTRAMEIAR